MDTLDKLKILTGSARYDASCASSGSSRSGGEGSLGNASSGGICHSWSDDGRCISLLKVLLSNDCRYDCAYCVNRSSNPVERTSFTVEELVGLTIRFYRRNYIEGLFLSSAVEKSPDYTMEKMVAVVRRLRQEEKFFGYIHMKIIPGCSRELVKEAGLYADRLSVNIELPSGDSLSRLAPQKRKESILKPMALLGETISANRLERKKSRSVPRFSPAGQSTQMIIGASPESDHRILLLSQGLYKKMNLKRVYYSAYVPVNHDNRLPVLAKPPLKREHRLYQADWLLRNYGFNADEILSREHPFLDEHLDPKAAWALRHPEFFPVDINRADYAALLRVPGIGVTSAKRIVAARRYAVFTPDGLKKIGVVMKRARYFITCSGKPVERLFDRPAMIRRKLLAAETDTSQPPLKQRQISLFQ
ncbi:putative DNA modification/repair radical SAM protein [Prosthecochloris sp. SCSIO W1102]|uniref:putative DNA modification/repair radical SAM protein n=1 Tax=Prosthecochloris sp. SCSIO W1102 TaxID=2992243 RepID=UPI00223E8EB7|nr:putative DNA modification/repair radical SAM protein [Prosthecochloris sp. SCSIO W1102]UZJ39179.1 putative DNA modification/repair radical SAM protein [Prosthecochloris sp. SCSIO W1102]